MNKDTLDAADMDNLRRRMAEARVFDVTEVRAETYVDQYMYKLLAKMASPVYKNYYSEFRKMYMDSMRPFMISIVTSQDTYLHPNWELS